MADGSVLGTITVNIGNGGGAFSSGGGPASTMPGGMGVGRAAKQNADLLGGIRKSSEGTAKVMGGQQRWWTKALKTMGIQMGIAGILKQSQIFTSVLGSLFQILGAFVDIMLAPWIPIIVPGLRKLADQVPRIRVVAQKFFDWVMGTPATILTKIWQALTGVKDFFSGDNPIATALTDIFDATGNVGKAVGALAATWAAAKTARYGLQATRWIPFVNMFTEPVRLLSKGIDKLFNKTASVLGRALASAVDSILIKLGLKTPKGLTTDPTVTPGKGGKVPSTVPDEYGAANRIVRRGFLSSGIHQAGRATGSAINRAKNLTFMDDLMGRGRTAGSTVVQGVSNLFRNTHLEDDFLNYADVRKPGATLRPFGVEGGRIGPALPEGGLPKGNAQLGRATALKDDFVRWTGEFFKKAGQSATRGGAGIKSLTLEGFSKLSTLIPLSRKFPQIGRVVAAYGTRFLKAIPFLGAAYMGMETTYELGKIWKSDDPWTGDMSSLSAWGNEALGMMGKSLGGGKKRGGWGWLTNPVGSVLGQVQKIPKIGNTIKNLNQTADRWAEASKQGALSGGKVMDFGIRAVTGYGGAAASFLPVLGQILGGVAYEAGRYDTMGIKVPWGDGVLGEQKYGGTELTDVILDRLMLLIRGEKDITLDGASGSMTGHQLY